MAALALAIFDLDGTLCDSVEDITTAVNAVLVRLGLRTLKPATVRSYVGRGPRSLMEKSLGETGRPKLDRAVSLLLDYYKIRCLDKTRLYPGVAAGLARLAAARKIVLSNKPRDISRTILETLGVAPYFSGIYGGDSFRAKKPDPEAVTEALRLHGARAEEAILVGDSDVDLLAARRAGARFLAVTYGYGSRADLEGADWTVDTFGDAVRILLEAAKAPSPIS
jgi:phosphoglycolate phosphatase